MERAAAETLALKALSFLAEDSEGFVRFLRISGLEIEDLRARAGDPDVLAGIMDYLLANEKLCEAFVNAEGLDPRELQNARRSLPGIAPEY